MKTLPTNKRLLNSAWKEYGVSNAILWEVIEMKNPTTIDVTFESSCSDREQGIWFASEMRTHTQW
jgi:hypothetical protein